jgi:hypothetical protein
MLRHFITPMKGDWVAWPDLMWIALTCSFNIVLKQLRWATLFGPVGHEVNARIAAVSDMLDLESATYPPCVACFLGPNR